MNIKPNCFHFIRSSKDIVISLPMEFEAFFLYSTKRLTLDCVMARSVSPKVTEHANDCFESQGTSKNFPLATS